MKSLYVNLFVAAMALFLFACGKDGATGPAGPQGPAGPAGSGSSEIIYSGWLDVPFKPDTIHLSGGGIDTTGYFASINVPKLDLTMLTNGDVKVYINTDKSDDPYVIPLPYYDNSGVSITTSFYLNTIQIESSTDLSTFTRNGVKYYQFRYVLIPGGKAARTGFDWNDYNAVKAKLNLKD